MTYKDINDPNFLKDIQSRREYVSLKLTRETLDKTTLTTKSDNEDLNQIIADLMVKTSNQIFIGNLMNPNTKIKRILLKWSTGIGKTIGALLVAVSMIKNFEKTRAATGTDIEKMPNIFVIGHTRERVIDDLLKFPEFGFVSPQELDRQRELNTKAITGDPTSIILAKDHYIMLKRRVTNKARGGYFRFFGYQELVNRFFGISKDDTSTSNLISNIYDSDPELFEINIKKAVADKLITVNHLLLEEFSNSLMIVDECHNDYNTTGMNSWGATQAYIADNANNLRIVFMSASPATNSVGEFIDIMNLLTESHEFPRLKRNKNVDIAVEVKKRLLGRVSYLQDSDLRTYPRRVFYGEDVSVNNVKLPYLKFLKCPMSKLQIDAFTDFDGGKVAKTINEDELDEAYEGKVMDRDDYYIRDIAIPNPDSAGPPLYRAKEAKVKVSNASDLWKKTNKIDVQEGRFVGEFLKSNTIGKYSSKYKALIDRVLKLPGLEKIVLFHNFVKMSGVYMLAELLRTNGYIDYDTADSDSTICAICNKPKSDHYIRNKPKLKSKSDHDVPKSDKANDNHESEQTDAPLNISELLEIPVEDEPAVEKTIPNKKAEFPHLLSTRGDHDYMPSRFGIVHGEQPQYVNQRIFKIYNDPSNIQGIHMRVLIGAQMIRESIDLKAVRHFEILSMPRNIPTFIQIIGRGIRKGSHDGLPMEDKVCEIAVYISTYPDDRASIEELSYAKKLNDYVEIQKIEQIIHAGAVDAAIHRDIIMSPDILAQYGPDLNNPKPVLGTLYYTPTYDVISKNPTDLTYYAYGYQQNEITILTLLIRRLFYITNIWTFEDLIDAVRDPPFRTEISPTYMTEDNIAVALNMLIIQMAKKEEGKWAIVRYGIYYLKMPKIQNFAGALVVSAPDANIFASGLNPPIRIELNKVLNRDIIISNGVNELKEKLINKHSKYELTDIFAELDVSILDVIGRKLVTDYKVRTDEQFLKLFNTFNLLIKQSEVPKSLNLGNIKTHTSFVGFLSSTGPTLFIGGQWKKINATSAEIKKLDHAREQGPVVGYVEEAIEGRIVFKTRRTLKEIEKEIVEYNITDARLFERGAICTTKNKDDLIKILKLINTRSGIPASDYAKLYTKDICVNLRRQLMLSDAFMTGSNHRTF